MIFFFYGADSFRIRQKVNSIIEGYQAKHKSGLNFGQFDFGEPEELDKLKNFIDSSSMFAEKKLAIAENLFAASQDAQEGFLEYFKNSDILKTQDKFLVVAQELAISEDKKSKQKYVLKTGLELFKALTDLSTGALRCSSEASREGEAKVEEFDYLAGVKLEVWIKKAIETEAAKIDALAVRKLAEFVGPDLWQMKNEIDKLITFVKGETINEAAVDKLVKAKTASDIFKTIDALALRNKQAALTFLHRHLAEGKSEIYLLSMLVYQFRNLLLVKSEIERGVQFQSLSKSIKLRPFVLRKSFEQGKGFSLAALKKIYERLLELDIATKTGRIEPCVALDLIVSEISG